MRILVTGAEGYIGRHLVPKLQKAGHEVLGIKRSHIDPDSPGIRDFLNIFSPEPGFQYDLADPDFSASLAKVLDGAPPDVVIHLAGRVEISLLPNPKCGGRPRGWIDVPPVPGPCDIGALYRDNVTATANVLDYCLKAGVKHLIFSSSQSVYGMGDCDEYDQPFFRPLEHYAASKLAAETMVKLGASESLSVSVLRVGGVYGEDRKSGLVYRMLTEAMTNGTVTVNLPYPLPLQVIHIDDALDAICAAIVCGSEPARDPHIWDVVHEELCSVTKLAAEVASLVPGCRAVLDEAHNHPVMGQTSDRTACALDWHPKPRKERLAQVLEDIRRGS